LNCEICKISVSNDISFVSLSPYLQHFGEDCRALVVILGVGMNLVPILVTNNGIFGALDYSVLAHIMEFLSDDWAGRLLERIQNLWGRDSDRDRNRIGIMNRNRDRDGRFQPRCPTSREDVRALRRLDLHCCKLTGEYFVFLLS
jgi:hypothetical protein